MKIKGRLESLLHDFRRGFAYRGQGDKGERLPLVQGIAFHRIFGRQAKGVVMDDNRAGLLRAEWPMRL